MSHLAASGLLIFISSIFSCSFVLLKGPKKELSVTWALASFSVAAWGFGLFKAFSTDYQSVALFWTRFLNLSALFIPIFFFHFVLSFLEKVETKKKELIYYYFIISLYFLFSLAVPKNFIPSVSPIFFFRYYPVGGKLYFLFPLLYIYLIGYGILLLLRELFSASPYRRNQIKYLLIGVALGFVGGATTFFPIFGIKIYPYGTYLVPIYVLTVAYAILKHRLMGIEVILWRGFLLIGAFLVSLVAGYISFYITDNVLHLSGRMGAGISGIWMLAVFGALLWRLNETVFKKEDLKLATLKDASLEMVVFPDPVRLSSEICKQVFQTLEPTYAHIYLVEAQKEKYQLQYLIGESERLKESITSSDPILKWFIDALPKLLKKDIISQKSANILYYHNIVERWLTDKNFLNNLGESKSILLDIKKQMEEMQAIVVVASSYKRNLYELLVLGEKRSGFYSPSDLEVLSSLSRIAAMNVRNALTIADLHRKVRDKTALIQEMSKRTVQMVMSFNKAVDARDAYTAEHSEEVYEIGKWISEEMQIPMTKELEFGLKLHDIGKIGIADSVLLKEGKLNEQEFASIKKHPQIGYEILGIMDFFKNVAEITHCHQERYDGKGYPRGLKGEEIPVEARIIAVADAYHAMTSDRPYREAMPMQDVIRQLLKGRAAQFDPDVIDALIRKLLKMRLITKKLVKHVAIEEALVPFGEVDLFLKKVAG